MTSSAPSVSAPVPRRTLPGAGALGAIAAWTALVALVAAIAVRRWAQIGDYATGIDPGNWFAFGKQLLGEGGKSTAGVYPPLIPLLMQLGRTVADPMTVAKVAAVGSLLAVTAVAYVVARQGMARWAALVVIAMVGSAGVLTETVAFGGYPQNYALAFMLLAALLAAQYLVHGDRRHLLASATSLAGVALSHHMYFAVTCLVILLIWLLWLSTRPRWWTVLTRSCGLGAASMVSLACFLPTYIALHIAGYEAPINAAGFRPSDALRHAIAEAPWLWLGVLIAGVAYTVLTVRRRGRALWKVQAALILASGSLFLVTAEQRLLPPLLIGSALGAGTALDAFATCVRGTVLAGVPAMLGACLILLSWSRADARAAQAFDFYRVVDASLLRAAAYVDQHHDGQLVVVRHDAHGWPVGWWFEGLTSARIAVGSNPAWLAFPEERAHARLAARFFDHRQTSAEAAGLARQAGVGLLVARKWDWIGWLAWSEEPDPQIRVVFDDGVFVVMAVAPDATASVVGR